MLESTFPSRLVVADFEFRPREGLEGNPIEVICGCFKVYNSSESATLWHDELYSLTSPPFFDELGVTLVAFFAPAELACFRALGWSTDVPVIDLYAEFRILSNGLELPGGRSLLGALQYFGRPSLNIAHKEAMRQLALRGGPYSDEERASLLAYCAEDVEMTQSLLSVMVNLIDVPRALLRGRFCSAIADMETHGTPIDLATLDRLRSNWAAIKDLLTVQWDRDLPPLVVPEDC